MIGTETPRVVRASYVLRQQFRYEYPGPIEDLRHRLVVAPPARYGDQRRARHRLEVSDGVNVRWTRDRFGNAVVLLAADRFEGTLELAYEASIGRRADASHPPAAWYDATEFRASSALTKPSLALRAAAESLTASDDGSGRLAETINAFVAQHMRYVSDVTSVDTTAAEAFAQGTGVCQDYAHVMIALCRLCGIPARYVSGTSARRGRDARVGRGDRAGAGQWRRRGRGVRSDARPPRELGLRLHRRGPRLQRRHADVGLLRRAVRRPLHDDALRRRARRRVRRVTYGAFVSAARGPRYSS